MVEAGANVVDIKPGMRIAASAGASAGTSSALQQAMNMVRGGYIWHAMGMRADGTPRHPEDPRVTGLAL